MNQKPIKVFAWIFCILFAASSAMAQTGIKHAFSVKECVDYAHKNNLQVKNALLNVQIQLEINRDVTASALPSLTGIVNGNDYLKIPTSLLPGEIFGQPAGLIFQFSLVLSTMPMQDYNYNNYYLMDRYS